MDFFQHYFPKRFWMFFLVFFLVWYPGSFFLTIAHSVTLQGVLYVALNTYFPLLLFLFSFFYFKKSANDWNDRFLVAFSWILFSFVLSALLVGPVYGLSFTTIMNLPQFEASWISFLVVLIAGMLRENTRAKHY